MDNIYYAVVAVNIIYIIYIYNYLIRAKNEKDNMMGSIDAILKKRYDMIPNLVAIVREYASFESSLLERISKFRSNYRDDMSLMEKSSLSTQLTKDLKELAVVVENYPTLKANVLFMHLQKSIAIVEEELSAARRVYNQSVTNYNDKIEMFPSNIIAWMMKLSRAEVFMAEEQERIALAIAKQ